MNTVAAIDLILSEGQRQSTYKLAVLRAVVDVVIERPNQEPRNGFHLLPVLEVARRTVAYFWKPVRLGIPQGWQHSSISRTIERLGDSNVPGARFDLAEHDIGAPLIDWLEGAPLLPEALKDALLDIRASLIEQPLQYLHNLRSRRAEVFNLVTLPRDGEPGLPMDASYEDHRRAAPSRRAFNPAQNWRELLDLERTYIVLSSRAYEEITEFRYWLRDAILMRWLQESGRFSRGKIPVPASCLDLHLPARDPQAIGRVRHTCDAIAWKHCIYTGQELRGTRHIDHVLPFSRFPVNLFWNLVPTAAASNLSKSDHIPRFTDPVKERYQDYLFRCVDAGGEAVAEDLDWTWRKYFQQQGFGPLDAHQVSESVWTIMDRAWARLEQAGISVWEPGG